MCNLLLSMINSSCVPSVVHFWWSLMGNSLGVLVVKRKCELFVYCRLDSRKYLKGQVSKDKTLFLVSEVLHRTHGHHAGPQLAEAKCPFVSFSSNSALNGAEICVSSCLSPTKQKRRPFSATSSTQNCASCLPITQFFTAITAIIMFSVQ